jgi:excisionase family DNA binding protein
VSVTAEPAEWLTIAQAADLLQVSERTIIRATKAPRDRLLAARFGNVTRIRRATFDRWLRAREGAA